MNPRVLHVARGARRGAEVPLSPGSRCVIGAAPSMCDLVLEDPGVAPCHCAITLDAAGRVVCTAMDAPVAIGRRELAPGASMSMPDYLPLRCGQAVLLLGAQGSDWSFALRAADSAPGLAERADGALQQVRSTSPLAFAALLLSSMLVVTGSVWGAVRWLSGHEDPAVDSLTRTQRWLISVAPRDSELQLIVDESRQRLVVAGYVRSEHERQALAAAIARRAGGLAAEVTSAERLTAAVSEAARQQGLRCEAEYRGGGRVACRNELTDEAAAERLRSTAAAQVEGLSDLQLSVSELPQVALVDSSAPRRYAVLMSNLRGNALIGPDGRRWREGDTFDGMRILRIGLDQVVFERNRLEHEVALGALR